MVCAPAVGVQRTFIAAARRKIFGIGPGLVCRTGVQVLSIDATPDVTGRPIPAVRNPRPGSAAACDDGRQVAVELEGCGSRNCAFSA